MNELLSNPFVIALISTLLVSGLFYILEYFITKYRNKSNVNKANDMVISKVITYMFSHKEFNDFILESVIEGVSKTLEVKKDKMHTIHQFRSIIILRLIDNVTFNNEEKQSIVDRISKIKGNEERNKVEEELMKEAEDGIDDFLRKRKPKNNSILQNRKVISLVMLVYLYMGIFIITLYSFREEFYIEIERIMDLGLVTIVGVSFSIILLLTILLSLILVSKLKRNN
ncbi:hypothetical protein [Salinicoccus kekensis]|uniref:Uncharacterized protein n=1 Tax=Salinicoccus kekensis TaxID=714307 RepID=A0A285URG7_9STAP|nr:hypothetical protein [Salinicoccus kekensis]SOC44297.1 hypothetical protein SAMN05878391_2273 [Salinicoccus kekensis]